MRGCPPDGAGTCRRDPIPPGIYWLDVVHGPAADGVDRRDHFGYWVAANRPPAAPERVAVLSTTEHEDRTWALVRVLEPANRWAPDTGLGLPTVAPRGVETVEADTVQRPPPEPGIFDFLSRTTIGIPNVAWFGLAAIGVYVLASRVGD